MSNKYVNIILGSSEWQYYHRKEFTKALAENGEVISFVNYPVSLSVNIFVKFWSRLVAFLTGKCRPYYENEIIIFTPLILFHYIIWRKFRLLAMIDSSIMSTQINRFIKKYHNNYIIRLWVYTPEQKYLIGKIKYDLLIYDYYDDQELNADGSVCSEKKQLNEIVVTNCDLMIVVAKCTYDKFSVHTKKILRSRNGYSMSIFGNDKKKIKLTNSSKPILGYIGAFRDWIDYSLIDNIVESGEFTLVFVGYISREAKNYFNSILKNKDVIHVNNVDSSELPLYINNFAAGLIPFKINDFMKSVYPNKFFEYISSEIPVITTALPELEIYKDYLGYSKNNEEFLINCRKVLKGDFSSKVGKYSLIKQNNDWNSIVKEIILELNKIIPNREIC